MELHHLWWSCYHSQQLPVHCTTVDQLSYPPHHHHHRHEWWPIFSLPLQPLPNYHGTEALWQPHCGRVEASLITKPPRDGDLLSRNLGIFFRVTESRRDECNMGWKGLESATVFVSSISGLQNKAWMIYEHARFPTAAEDLKWKWNDNRLGHTVVFTQQEFSESSEAGLS